jgi:hypothetical protein
VACAPSGGSFELIEAGDASGAEEHWQAMAVVGRVMLGQQATTC